MSCVHVTPAFNFASVTERHTYFCLPLLNIMGQLSKKTLVPKMQLQFYVLVV